MGIFTLKTAAGIDGVVAVFEVDSEVNIDQYVSAFIGSLATLVSKHEDDKAASETVLAFYLKLGLSYTNIEDFFTTQNNFWAVSVENNRIVDFMFPNNGEIKISEKLTVERGKGQSTLGTWGFRQSTLDLITASDDPSDPKSIESYAVEPFPYVTTKVLPGSRLLFLFSFSKSVYPFEVLVGALFDAIEIFRACTAKSYRTDLSLSSIAQEMRPLLKALADNRRIRRFAFKDTDKTAKTAAEVAFEIISPKQSDSRISLDLLRQAIAGLNSSVEMEPFRK